MKRAHLCLTKSGSFGIRPPAPLGDMSSSKGVCGFPVLPWLGLSVFFRGPVLPWLPAYRRGMSRLVHPKFLSAWQPHLRDPTPRLIVHGSSLDAFRAKFSDRAFDVVAHEIQLVGLALVGRMDREFARRRFG